MLENFLILVAALFFLVKGATWATKYSVGLAESCRLSKYIIGFMVVAIISVMPEAFISLNSALAGMPEFGLATLFGSNVADLTLVFAIIIAFHGRGLKIQSAVLKNTLIYPFLLLIPLILGLNGHYTRLEGLALIIAGGIFYFFAFKNNLKREPPKKNHDQQAFKHFILLLLSLGILLAAAHYTVTAAAALAGGLSVSPILVGMLIVGLGTTMPEMIFSIKCSSRRDDSLAIGDILGTVLADATIVVGLLALVSPFYFPKKIIYSTGMFMLAASLLLFYFMRSGRQLSKNESRLLFAFWIFFAVVEYFIN